jgi:DNA polymerase III epsilon subunit family exonuclease
MDLQRNIEDFDLVFLDLETTGLDVVEGDSICEVGAFKVRNREVIDKFYSLVNPKKSVPRQAYLIHKISDEELKDAPVFEDIADKLVSFLNDTVVCAYNVKFDMDFLTYELRRANLSVIEPPAVDILGMARRCLKLTRYNLGAIAQYFNIECKNGLHRACDDAAVAQTVFFKLRDMLVEAGINRLGEYVTLFGLDNEVFKQQEGEKVNLLNEAKENKKRLKLRYFSDDNVIKEVQIDAVNFSQDNRNSYIWCHSTTQPSFRLKLNNVLNIEIS